MKVRFFLITVAVSNLIYVEAFENEISADFNAGTVHALEAYA